MDATSSQICDEPIENIVFQNTPRMLCQALISYRWQKKYCNKMDEARPRNLEIWEILNRNTSPKYKFSKSKSVLPKMLARCGLVGKYSSRPSLLQFQTIFPWAAKMQKMRNCYLCSLVGQWALFTRFGEMVAIFLLPPVSKKLHPTTQNGHNLCSSDWRGCLL